MDEEERARLNSDERKLAFGHAIADLFNQWSMEMVAQNYLCVGPQTDGLEMRCTGFDSDGDLEFNDVPEGRD